MFGIEQDAVADSNPAGVWLGQSSDAIEQSSFAGSGWAKQNGEAGLTLEVNFQEELVPLNMESLAEKNFQPLICPFSASFLG
jgi:hypothetical protein